MMASMEKASPMSEKSGRREPRWGIAWILLVGALALHVTDEALTGFLPLYNSIVSGIREQYPLFPFPTFTFGVWLGGLCAIVTTLFFLSPLVFAGRWWLRWVSYALSFIMILNGLGHITASLLWGRFAPGVYSSPFLLAAAIHLWISAYRSSA